MALEDIVRGDTIKYLELLNESLSNQIVILNKELQDNKELNKLLLQRLGIIERIKEDISINFKPVGGYIPLRERIREAEAKSREEADKLNAGQEREAI